MRLFQVGVISVILAIAAGTFPMSAATSPRIQVQGHRGARAVLPENSLPAFRYAIQNGADVIELDVLLTRDDVPVVVHDPVLNPAICSGPGDGIVRKMTLAELRLWDCGARPNPEFPKQKPIPGTRIPTLEEVLALAAEGDFLFNIEIKVDGDDPAPELSARLVLEAVKRAKLESRVIIQSFDFRALHAVRELDPGIPLAALWSGKSRDFVEIARQAGAQIFAPYYHLIETDQVEKAHRAGLKIIPWTVNDPADWDRMIEAGVDGIITDDPSGLIAHLKQKGLR